MEPWTGCNKRKKGVKFIFDPFVFCLQFKPADHLIEVLCQPG